MEAIANPLLVVQMENNILHRALAFFHKSINAAQGVCEAHTHAHVDGQYPMKVASVMDVRYGE